MPVYTPTECLLGVCFTLRGRIYYLAGSQFPKRKILMSVYTPTEYLTGVCFTTLKHVTYNVNPITFQRNPECLVLALPTGDEIV